jgi:hypothetical protein
MGVNNRRFFVGRLLKHLDDRTYTECPQLKAIAVHLGVDLVSIHGRSLFDGCNFYSADGAVILGPAVSWRGTLLPRLQRQRAGKRLPGERSLIVLIWNGVNHFDAAVLADGRPPAPHVRGARKRVRDAADESMIPPAQRRMRRTDVELETSSSCEVVGAVDGDAVWPSIAAMLDPAGLELLKVAGDGACAYWAALSTIDGGLSRAFWANGRRPLSERDQDDRDACALMRNLRQTVVSWLVAPAQRRMLCAEPSVTLTFDEYCRGL